MGWLVGCFVHFEPLLYYLPTLAKKTLSVAENAMK